MAISSQKFKCGSTEIVLDLSSITQGVQFIYVGDVLDAFGISAALRFEINGMTIPYMRDARGIMYNPKRIPCRPQSVIQVIRDPTARSNANSNTTTTTTTIIPKPKPPASIFSIDFSLGEFVNEMGLKGAIFDGLTSPRPRHAILGGNSITTTTTTTKRTTAYIQGQLDSLNAAVAFAKNSGRRLSAEELDALIAKYLLPATNGNTVAQNVDLLVRDVSELKIQASKMLKMQQETLDRLALIKEKTETIMSQQLEITEFPIPRLFLVLPEEEQPTKYDRATWFKTKFRLHFICECGRHTEDNNKTKGQHHPHLAKHNGYIVRDPVKLFKKYGPFLLLMLRMIKFGTSIAGHVVPPLASLKTVELAKGIKQSVESVAAKIDYSLECIDNQYATKNEGSDSDSGEEELDPQAVMTQQNLANFLNNVEGLEGFELRQLRSFLKISSQDNLFGNLFRMTTSEGHAKWVCLDHYRTGYQEQQVEKLRKVVKLAGGKFDEQQGKITIVLKSGFVAAEFYGALSKIKGVLELDVNLDWDCAKNDIEMLEAELKNTRVSILKLDLQRFRTGFGSQFLPSSAQFGSIFRFRDLPNMKAVHIIVSLNHINLFSFQPKKSSRNCKMSFQLGVGGIGENEFGKLAEAIRINSALTILVFRSNSIKEHEAGVLFESLRTNRTLTTLSMNGVPIGDQGALTLSKSLKTNSALKTLELYDSWMTEYGSRVLFEALKTNSTLTTLDLESNSIGEKGALALSEALKFNSTLITLDLGGNSIGEKGAQALSEVLKTNSTLIFLGLRENTIGVNGALALSKALAINKTLTALDMKGNPMGVHGARALSEVFKTSSTLTILDM